MRIEKSIVIPSITKKIVTLKCDYCQSENNIHTCEICGKDVCLKCAPGCDDYIEYNYFSGDRPFMYVCSKCHINGLEYIEAIEDLRRNSTEAEASILLTWKEQVRK